MASCAVEDTPMKRPMLLIAGLLLAAPVCGQTGRNQAGPDQAGLEAAVQLGTLATLAPLCGLRAEEWAFDLRRAALMEATRSARPDDPALRAAPGRALVEGALSFADTEATESFAEAPHAETCEPLAANPDLLRADGIVRAFRALKDAKPAS
jgi:hypothetical protein